MKYHCYNTAMFSIFLALSDFIAKLSSMKVMFCGHSQIFEDLEEKIKEILHTKIKGNAVEFYLGGYGNFDDIAEKCCKEYKKTHANCKLYYITPYIDEKYLNKKKERLTKFDNIIYPNLETTPPKYVILQRNYWMAKQSDLIIAYINYSWGGAAKTIEYAIKQKKKIINKGNKKLDN